MASCESDLGHYGEADSYEVCGAYADELVTAGCVHEHLTTQPTCQPCLDKLLAKLLWCDNCENSDTPHRCLVVLVARESIAA